jgi:hypothetical protein
MNTDNTHDAAEPSLASAGSHGSASRWNGVPVAWAAVGKNGVPLWLAYHRQDAQGAVVGMAQVVPLYRNPQPTLTAEERGAIEIAIPFLPDGPYTEYDGTPRPDRRATLRALLERTK